MWKLTWVELGVVELVSLIPVRLLRKSIFGKTQTANGIPHTDDFDFDILLDHLEVVVAPFPCPLGFSKWLPFCVSLESGIHLVESIHEARLQKSGLADKTCNGTSGVCTSRKAEEENLISRGPVVGEEVVGFADVFVQATAEGA